METSTTKRMHPLTAIAAVSVTLFSLVGIGAITGLIPTSHSQSAPTQAVKPAEEPLRSAAAAQSAEDIPAATVPEFKPAGKPDDTCFVGKTKLVANLQAIAVCMGRPAIDDQGRFLCGNSQRKSVLALVVGRTYDRVGPMRKQKLDVLECPPFG